MSVVALLLGAQRGGGGDGYMDSFFLLNISEDLFLECKARGPTPKA